jgi:hypothetical protein
VKLGISCHCISLGSLRLTTGQHLVVPVSTRLPPRDRVSGFTQTYSQLCKWSLPWQMERLLALAMCWPQAAFDPCPRAQDRMVERSVQEAR